MDMIEWMGPRSDHLFCAECFRKAESLQKAWLGARE